MTLSVIISDINISKLYNYVVFRIILSLFLVSFSF